MDEGQSEVAAEERLHQQELSCFQSKLLVTSTYLSMFWRFLRPASLLLSYKKSNHHSGD